MSTQCKSQQGHSQQLLSFVGTQDAAQLQCSSALFRTHWDWGDSSGLVVPSQAWWHQQATSRVHHRCIQATSSVYRYEAVPNRGALPVLWVWLEHGLTPKLFTCKLLQHYRPTTNAPWFMWHSSNSLRDSEQSLLLPKTLENVMLYDSDWSWESLERYCYPLVLITPLLYHYRAVARLASVQTPLHWYFLHRYSKDTAENTFSTTKVWLLISVLKTYCTFTALSVQATRWL